MNNEAGFSVCNLLELDNRVLLKIYPAIFTRIIFLVDNFTSKVLLMVLLMCSECFLVKAGFPVCYLLDLDLDIRLLLKVYLTIHLDNLSCGNSYLGAKSHQNTLIVLLMCSERSLVEAGFPFLYLLDLYNRVLL